MGWADVRVCAAHMLEIARQHEPRTSALGYLMFLRPRDDLQQLSQHIGNVVPQPAHISQIKARSVERAMRASHGATGWACQAAGDAAHLARLWSARGGVHREIVGKFVTVEVNLCLKRLTPDSVARAR